jgi:hypothetical protein
MKKLLLTVVSVLLSVGIYAQSNTTMRKSDKKGGQKKYSNGILLKDGKMMLLTKGKSTLMKNGITMANGTHVMLDGNYVLKNGTTFMMTEGEYINLAGNLIPIKIMYLDGDKMKDGVIMQEGKIMTWKNNNKVLLEKEVTLENGTHVMLDGQYLLKNGTNMIMKEGDYLNLAGKMVPREMIYYDGKIMNDGVMMQDGKMNLWTENNQTELKKEVTMGNGTSVMANGSYILKNGTKMMLKEGEHMNLDGIIKPQRMKHHDGFIMKEGVMMQNGKMMMCTNDSMTVLVKELTMKNGTLVMTDGNYMLKNGYSFIMKEGEHMNLDGKLIPAKKNKNKSIK